jgi:hypothetical protein
MSHVTIMPLRKPQQFFGQDCLTEKLAHAAIEHDQAARGERLSAQAQ